MSDQFTEARLLVVDDNAANVALLRAVFTRAGFRNIFIEMDSRQVAAILPQVDPDLVILDLHMPHLDGFAVMEQIRDFSGGDYLPVLVLTADTTPTASHRALTAGAHDFVTTPFSNSEILQRARNLLETRFTYTSLRGSIMRESDEREIEERRLNLALASEQEDSERLREQDDLKDTLLQAVSHDLRNPMSAVLALSGMLLADANETAPLSDAMRLAIIAKVQLGAREMEGLVKDLLDSDPMRTAGNQYRTCDVGALVQGALAKSVLSRNHPVATELDSVKIGIDPIHVERIVENLLSNAEQHVPAGVQIWVKTAAFNDGVLISVEDAGAGITPDRIEQVFEPFLRGADAESHGVGLGLSLVARFAALHGGRAWVEERPGGGAAFRVSLPSHPASGPSTVAA